MPLAEKRETWLNPAEWKSFDKDTTACYQGVGQLRVETFSNRKDLGRSGFGHSSGGGLRGKRLRAYATSSSP